MEGQSKARTKAGDGGLPGARLCWLLFRRVELIEAQAYRARGADLHHDITWDSAKDAGCFAVDDQGDGALFWPGHTKPRNRSDTIQDSK